MKKRNEVEIVSDILELCLEGSLKTTVVYKVNLNFQMFDRYFVSLKEKGLLVKEGKLFKTTELGREVLSQIGGLIQFLR